MPSSSGPDAAVRSDTLRLFWSVAAARPMLLACALIAPALTVLVASFIGPLLIAKLLEEIVDGTLTASESWGLFLAFAATQFAGQVVGWRIVLFAMWSFVREGRRELFASVFAHLVSQSLSFHADRFGGALVAKTNKLLNAYHLFWKTIVWQIVPVATTIVAAVVIMAFVLPLYAVFLAGMSVVFVAAVLLSRPKLEALNVVEAQAAAQMTGFLADVMTNISTVKSDGTEDSEQSTAQRVAGHWTMADRNVMRSFLGYSTLYSSVIAITNIGAVAVAAAASSNSTLDIPGIYLALTYTMVVTEALWKMNQIMQNYTQVLGDAHHMVGIMRQAPSVSDSSDRPLQRGPGEVRFEGVRFGHHGRGEQPLFDGLDLVVAAGEKVGLVGHSGSGKTTLTRLLLRYWDVDAGRILIDGQDIRDVTQSSLRRAIAYVPQESLLFHRSLRDNITYGDPDATDEQVREAAARAQALDFIEALPNGFDTLVGERGVKLSGGQQQRIGIARAILKDVELLVLDEATSALDSSAEAEIQAALAEVMKGRTTIVIAHRLSTVASMDRIVVMADGRIVEQGPPAELLARSGAYARLWQQQSGGFMQ